ncbi:MAG: hypothetical protein KIT48_09315 [Pseudolabrys sp.]|nr:hypothetical protein [Pseudolabrys sp.]
MTAAVKAQKYEAREWLLAHVSYTGDDCLIWPFSRDPYYGRGRIGAMNGSKKMFWAHRMMCELVNGPPPSPAHQAAHECGKGHEGCVNPRHLSWKTQSGNALDRLRHGHRMGNRRGNKTRFTANQIEELRADLAAGRTTVALAAKYKVARSVITFWKGKFKKNPTYTPPQPKGASLHSCGKWQAKIRVDGKFYHLGLYETFEEANQAFIAARARKDAGLPIRG